MQQTSSSNNVQTFHMSLLEPLVLIIIPLFGVYLSISLLLSKPMPVKIYVPILILVFCLYAIAMGLTMPRKLEIQGEEIIINNLAWKQIIKVSEVDSYFIDSERGKNRTRYFVTVQLNNGKKIKIKNAREGNQALLSALQQWTGFKPTVDLSEPEPDFVEKKTRVTEHAAPVPLSERTETIIQKMFPVSTQSEVRHLLTNECGNNIYAHEQKDKNGLEPLRFAALKTSKGDVNKLKRAIKIANQDFRDLYAEAGFLGDNADPNIDKWVQSILSKQ